MVVFDYRRKPWKEVLDFIKTVIGRTLDVGCGNGDITKLLKNAVGIDISEELLEKARKKSKNKFIKAKCEDLPFENEEFDNVLLIAVLHNLKKISRKRCLEEIYRVLKDKGRLFLSVWCKKHWILKKEGKKFVMVSEECKSGFNYLKWGEKRERYYYFFNE